MDHSVEVKEAPPSRLLPSSCPQRHINPNGSFCIGLSAGRGIQSCAASNEWWGKLEGFLLCQETATATGQWPSGAQISHGEAGEIQDIGEKIALSLGLLEDFSEAVVYGTGRIADLAAKIDKTGGRFRNGRAECLCGRTDKNGRLTTRRDCIKDNSCLAFIELQRQKAEKAFWKRYAGSTCCSTMKGCPLKKIP
jgi:hypothetical protein